MATIQTILTFHSIGPLERQAEDNEMLYNVSTERFEEWVATISNSSPQCTITFDDGNKSDFEIALPILKKYGITAKFFPILSRIGQQGYMTWDNLQTLIKEDMQIGSHGLNHTAWTGCTDSQLVKELWYSRKTLEKKLGRPIVCAAAPFGAVNPYVFHAAKKAGYTKLYTSSHRSSFTGSSLVPRFSVKTDMNPTDYIATQIKPICRIRSSFKNFAQNVRYNVSGSK